MIMLEYPQTTITDHEKHYCTLSFIAVLEIAVEAISTRRDDEYHA